MTTTIENEGNGFYAIIGGSNRAAVYSRDIPGAGGKWFPTHAEAQAACDAWNSSHADEADGAE
jgi:hypothetical protein